MPALQYWFCSEVLYLVTVTLVGWVLVLIDEKTLNSTKRFWPILITATFLTLCGWYISAKQNSDANKKDNNLEDKIDSQLIIEKDTRDETAMVLSVLRKVEKEELAATSIENPTPTVSISPLVQIIEFLKSSVALGEKVQEEGSNGDVSFSDYLKDREKWLSNVRYFLLTDKTIQENEKWKEWAGNGGDEGIESRDD